MWFRVFPTYTSTFSHPPLHLTYPHLPPPPMPLAGQKGSDVSAKEATRKMITAAKQLETLQALIVAVAGAAEEHGITLQHHNTVPHASGGGLAPVGQGQARPGGVPLPVPLPAAMHLPSGTEVANHLSEWCPKNTLVRGVVREMAQQKEAARPLRHR